MSRKVTLFQATDGTNGIQLWSTDGASAAGTSMLVQLATPGDASPTGFLDLGTSKAILNATDSSGAASLWVTDGTAGGTAKVLASGGTNVGNPAGMIALGTTGKAIFRATDAALGREIWVTGGTQAGTFMLKDINPGLVGSVPVSIELLSGGANAKVIFAADNGTNGAELWVTDGMVAGTSLVKDINTGAGGAGIASPTPLGDGRAVFAADDGSNGLELWVTDGTSAGTTLVRNINTTAATGSGVTLTALLSTGKALFRANNGTSGAELWATDGTSAGTTLVKDINAGAGNANPSTPVTLGSTGRAVFRATDAANGTELWVTDGTSAGTTLVKNINAGSASSTPSNFFAMSNGKVLFTADDGTTGIELWATDGTSAGTTLVRNINTAASGTTGSSPAGFAEISAGHVLFSAFDPVNGTEIWRTDGTSAGTVLVSNIVAGAASSNPAQIFAFTAIDVTMALTSDTGSSSTDGITKQAAVQGTADANDQVVIRNGATVLATVTADALGVWSYTPTLADGSYSLTARQTDAAGNSGSATISFTLDTTAPIVTAGIASDTGASGSDGITNNPTLTGTTDPNTTVIIFENGIEVTRATANGLGVWSATPTLSDGVHALLAQQIDAADNLGFQWQGITLDRIAPVVTVGLASDTGDSGSDGLTNSAVLTGTAEANGQVVIRNGAVVLATVTANGAGAWSYAPTLADGSYSLTAQQTDVAGNIGSATIGFTLDTTVPVVTAGIAQDTGASATDGITNNPTLTGTTDPNTTVIIFENGIEVTRATANGLGVWSATPTLSDGVHTLLAQQIDAAGNLGFQWQGITLDRSAPVVTAGLASDTGTSGSDGLTSSAVLTGTADANGQVVIRNGAVVLATVTADGAGAWSYAPTLADGSYSLTAQQTDAAGNSGSATIGFTLDTTAPAVTIRAAQDTGLSASDNITSDPTLVGTAGANAAVSIFWNNIPIGNTTADGAGNWSFYPLSIGDGTGTPSARQTDSAGNVGQAAVTITLDRVAPAAPNNLIYNPRFDQAPGTSWPHPGRFSQGYSVPNWAGTGGAGTSPRNGAYWDNGNIGSWWPTHPYVAFIQSAGSLTQTVAGLVPGQTYTISYLANARALSTPGAQPLLALDLSGAGRTDRIVAPFVLSAAGVINNYDIPFSRYSINFTAFATSLDLSFVGQSSAPGADTTLLLTDVSVQLVQTGHFVTAALRYDTGDSANDRLTSTAELVGTAEPNSQVVIRNGATVLATVTADGAGAWSYVPTLADGTYSLTAQQTDVAGNSGIAAVAPFTLLSAPVISAGLANDTGDSAFDGITRIATLRGQTNPGLTVQLRKGAVALGSVTADSTGAWSYTPGLGAGVHTITATARNAAGDSTSSDVTFTLDNVAPSTPANLIAAPYFDVAGTWTFPGYADGGGFISPGWQAAAGAGFSPKNGAFWDNGTVPGQSATSPYVGFVQGNSRLFTQLSGLTAGATYDVSLYVNARALDGKGRFSIDASDASGGSQQVIGLTDIAATNGAFRHVVGSFTASAASETLSLRGYAAGGDTSMLFASVSLRPHTDEPGVAVWLAADTGSSALDGLTNTAQLGGTAIAGRQVIISNGASYLGTAMADAIGDWNFSPVLADGSYSLTVTQVDVAGNSNSASVDFRLDASAPPVTVALVQDTGTSPFDGKTSNPAIRGTAAANSSVTISKGATVLAVVGTNAAGGWDYTPNLADGFHQLTVSQTDAAGNVGTATTSFTLDKTAPTVTARIEQDTGASGTDGITSNPSLVGTTDPNTTVIIFENGVEVTRATADGQGAWRATPTLTDGAHTLLVQQIDDAGNLGHQWQGITLDRIAPSPARNNLIYNPQFDLFADPPWPYPGLFSLGYSAPNWASTGLAGTSPRNGAYWDNGNVGSLWPSHPYVAFIQTEGSLTQTVAGLVPGQTYTISYLANSRASNTPGTQPLLALDLSGGGRTERIVAPFALGAVEAINSYSISFPRYTHSFTAFGTSLDLSFVGQRSAPGADTTLLLTDVSVQLASPASEVTMELSADTFDTRVNADTGAGATDRVTSNRTVKGRGEAGSSVVVSEGGVTYGTATVGGDGTWQATLTGLADGAHVLTAVDTDKAGNTGVATLAMTLDTKAPSISIGLKNGTPSGGISTSAAFTGTTEPGRMVVLKEGSTVLRTVQADSSTGVWSYTPAKLGNGAHTVTASTADLAGNTASSSYSFTLTAPVAFTVELDQDSGTEDKRTNNPTISGTASAGVPIAILYKGSKYSTTADKNTNWSWDPRSVSGLTLTDGAVTFWVDTPVDSAREIQFTLDRSAPQVTSFALVSDTGNSGSDRITGNALMTGVGEAGLFVAIYNDGTLLGGSMADSLGNWSFAPALADGAYTLTAQQTDVAGNTGSRTLSFQLDRQAPALSVTLASDTGPSGSDRYSKSAVLQGTSDANAQVVISEAGKTLGSVTANSSGIWTYDPTGTAGGFAQGRHTVTATSIDAAGNTGTAKMDFAYDTTAPDTKVPESTLKTGQGQTALLGGISINATTVLSDQTYTARFTSSSSKGRFTASITGADGGGSIAGSGTGDLAIIGTRKQINSNLASLAYLDDTKGTPNISVTITDQAGNSTSRSIGADIAGLPQVTVAAPGVHGIGQWVDPFAGKAISGDAGHQYKVTLTAPGAALKSNDRVFQNVALSFNKNYSGDGSLTFSGDLYTVNLILDNLILTYNSSGVQNVAIAVKDITANASAETKTFIRPVA